MFLIRFTRYEAVCDGVEHDVVLVLRLGILKPLAIPQGELADLTVGNEIV